MKINSLNKKPNLVALIIMLVGTSLLAVPASLGTLELLDGRNSPGRYESDIANILLGISFTGFAIYLGYFLTLLFRKFYFLFWLFSALYNGALTVIYLYLFITEFGLEIIQSPQLFFSFQPLFYIFVFLSWMTFMTAGSVYYLRCSKKSKIVDLP